MKNAHYFFTFFLLLFISACSESPPEPFLAVNLVGYPVSEAKIAMLVNAEADSFSVVRRADDTVIWSGKTGEKKEPDVATGDSLLILDFSALKDEGEYYIKTNSDKPVTSYEFSIRNEVYNDILLKTLKSYYYHRCGTKVGTDNSWSYDYCHLDDAPFYTDHTETADVAGGWHDAGDYNKFSVNTALSSALLLYLFDLKEDHFTDGQLYIPESGNGMPDILDELKWALNWMMKMQRHDGAVYHKVSQKKWIGEYLPHEDPAVRYLFETSTAATASFTAVSALAARLFRDYDPDYSDVLQKSALRGWGYLIKNPVNKPLDGFKNPPDVSGGEYGDKDDRDERLWASVELFRLTEEESFLTYFRESYRYQLDSGLAPISWRTAQNLAFHSYLEMNPHNSSLGAERILIKKAFLEYSDGILQVHKKNNYRNLIRHTEYYWGSNSVGLAYAFDLIQAYRLTGLEKYNIAALDQLHFILGRNPLNLSMVTGAGSKYVSKPYHQLSEVGDFDNAVPGMLVGGPNNHVHHRNKELSPFPAKNYQDTFQNFYVNEAAINFTAIFAYVVGNYSFNDSNNSHYTLSK